jgi:transcriptional regulator GlxA family with amidase domain
MTSARLPTKRLGVLLFPGFELLDVFGPLEMFGVLRHFGEVSVEITIVAKEAGAVTSGPGLEVLADGGYADCSPLDMILVPGGLGTREAVSDQALVTWLYERAEVAETVMTVCTGTQLLAATGLIDGMRATTNKAFFSTIAEGRPQVEWVKEARWVKDGKFVTSSGVSAGMDMALSVIADMAGTEVAEGIALVTEYEWHRDPSWDPFAARHGLSGN